MNIAIVIVSDKSFQGEREDKCGPVLTETLVPHAKITQTQIIPDDFEEIKETLIKLSDSGEVNF